LIVAGSDGALGGVSVSHPDGPTPVYAMELVHEAEPAAFERSIGAAAEPSVSRADRLTVEEDALKPETV